MKTTTTNRIAWACAEIISNRHPAPINRFETITRHSRDTRCESAVT